VTVSSPRSRRCRNGWATSTTPGPPKGSRRGFRRRCARPSPASTRRRISAARCGPQKRRSAAPQPHRATGAAAEPRWLEAHRHAEAEGAPDTIAVDVDAGVAEPLELFVIAAEEIARLELQLDLLAEELDALARDEVDAQARPLDDVRLADAADDRPAI